MDALSRETTDPFNFTSLLIGRGDHFLKDPLEEQALEVQIRRAKRDNRDNFPYYAIKTYVVNHHWNHLAKTVMRGHSICFC